MHRACAGSWHLAAVWKQVVRLTALVEEDIFVIYSLRIYYDWMNFFDKDVV